MPDPNVASSGVIETCSYLSTWAGTGLIPFDGNAVLNGQEDGSLFIPGYPGRTARQTVECNRGLLRHRTKVEFLGDILTASPNARPPGYAAFTAVAALGQLIGK